MGRLTLNPLAHIDLIGTIVIPVVLLVGSIAAGRGIVGFGWAKPVPVNVAAFRNPRRGILWVSFAGPLSNIALALIAGLVLRVAGASGIEVVTKAGEASPLLLIVGSIAIINLYLAFFNLIPVPPFDGSGVVSALLPVDLARKYENFGRFGTLVVLGIILIGGFFGVGIIESVIMPPALYLFKLFTGA